MIFNHTLNKNYKYIFALSLTLLCYLWHATHPPFINAQSLNSKSADFNHDDLVNIFDYNILIDGFGTNYNIFDYNSLVYDFGINLSNIGFNELFTLSHLSFISQWRPEFNDICLSEPKCPQNMPVYPATTAAETLQKIHVPKTGPIIRDIIPLKILEPTPNNHPFDSEIYSMLQQYADNSTNLTLSFTTPLPSWVTQMQDEEKTQTISQIITSFIERMSRYPLDHNWLSSHLTIEPINEINASLSGNPNFASRLDKLVKNELENDNIPHKEVVSSSIISGTPEQYLEWFKDYYQSDSTILPNIHLYVSDELDQGSLENAFNRFEKIITELNQISPSGNVFVGEVGISSVNQTVSTNRDEFIHKIVSSPTMQSTHRIIIWRLFRDWLSIPCTLSTCDPLTAKETTFGFINFNNKSAENQIQKYFLNSN